MWLERSRVIQSVPNLVEQVYQLIVKEDQAGQQGAYVEKHNFWYDLGLIFKTFWVIVKER